MSENVIPTFQVQQFSTNIQLLLQQKGSKLSGTVMTGSHVGKQASPVDQVGSVEAQKVTTRFSPMTRVDAPTDRRWVFPIDYDLPQLIDSFDKLRLITDPESVYVQNAMYAMGRARDIEIITAFTADAKTGESGGTTTSVLTANEVDVAVGGSNSRLNVAKLKAAREILVANHVDIDTDPLFCALTAKDEFSLLSEIEIISKEFKSGDAPVLRDGKLERFLGINFVYCEQLETTGAGTNEVNVPLWAKSGMYLGVWQDFDVSVSRRNDLRSEPWQAYVKQTVGATRLEEKKIVNIESYRA